jgi:hypothetical protein
MNFKPYCILIVLLAHSITCFAKSTPDTPSEKHDALYSRKTHEVTILAILEYEDLKIAAFRDNITGSTHPLQVNNELCGGKIVSVNQQGVRVHREGNPDLQFSVNNRIIRNKSPEHVTFSLKNADIRGVIANLARPAGIKILVDKRMKIKLSMTVKDLHWKDVLDILASTFGLIVTSESDAIRVSVPPSEPENPE